MLASKPPPKARPMRPASDGRLSGYLPSDPTSTTALKSVSKRHEPLAWCLYDWACTLWPVVVMTVYIGPFIATYPGELLGFSPSAFYVLACGVADGILAFLLPVLSAVAERTANKRLLLAVLTVIGAAACALINLADYNMALTAVTIIIGQIAFAGSKVVLHSFIPLVSAVNKMESVISRGYALGFLGAGMFLLLSMIVMAFFSNLYIPINIVVRANITLAGLWWLIWGGVSLYMLRGAMEDPVTSVSTFLADARLMDENYCTYGFVRTYRKLFVAVRTPHSRRFLVAGILYMNGLHSIVLISGVLGVLSLGLSIPVVATVVLVICFLAVVGALALDAVAIKCLGTRKTMVLCLAVLSISVGGGYFLPMLHPSQYVVGYWAFAGGIGLVIGAVMSLGRSFYSSLIPIGKEVEQTTFYELAHRCTAWLGPLIIGLVIHFASVPAAFLATAGLLLLAAIVLATVDERAAVAESGGRGDSASQGLGLGAPRTSFGSSTSSVTLGLAASPAGAVRIPIGSPQNMPESPISPLLGGSVPTSIYNTRFSTTSVGSV